MSATLGPVKMQARAHHSQGAQGSTPWVAAIFLSLTACSALDPSVGPWRIEQPVTDGGALDAGAEPCSEVGPDEVCFGRDIRPLIDRPVPPRGDTTTPKGCRSCHYSTELRHNGIDLGGLDLSTLGELRKGGGSSGKRIIVSGKPDESAIVQALRGTYPHANRMPKGSNYWLDSEIQLVADWIAQGGKGQDRE